MKPAVWYAIALLAALVGLVIASIPFLNPTENIAVCRPGQPCDPIDAPNMRFVGTALAALAATYALVMGRRARRWRGKRS